MNVGGVNVTNGSGRVGLNLASDGGGIFNTGGTGTLNGTPVTRNDPNTCAGDPVAGCRG